MTVTRRIITLGLVVGLAAACGDDNGNSASNNADNGGNSGANAQNAGNVGANAATYPRGGAALDTSDYQGRVMWMANTAGMTIDLAENAESQFTVAVNEDGQQLFETVIHTDADLSADASSVVFVAESPEFCAPTFDAGITGSVFGELTVVGADGQRATLSVETPSAAADCQSATQPSINGDGTRVAFRHRELDAETTGDFNIAIWDLAGEPTILTTDEANDYRPLISADGARVVFLSDRDQEGELYIMPTDGSAAPTKIAVEHPDLDGPARFTDVNLPSCSDDLSLCAFVAGEAGVDRGAFVVDTASGAVTRLGVQTDAVSASLSGDGRVAAVVFESETPLQGNIHIIDVSVADDGQVIGQMSSLSPLRQPPVLNTDGSLMLVANQEQGQSRFGEVGGLFNLTVWRTDGSGDVLVESDETDERFSLVGNSALGIR
jgi:Tol biopolymer transport system component